MAAAAAMPCFADDIRIEHLSPNHTFVRVKGDDKLMILPIQESIEDAKINVLVNGKLERTFFARLAKSKTDYTVPFDLSPYKGKDVILDVVSTQGRASVREAQDDACWSEMTLSDNFDTTNREKYRPLYHHTPSYGYR